MPPKTRRTTTQVAPEGDALEEPPPSLNNVQVATNQEQVKKTTKAKNKGKGKADNHVRFNNIPSDNVLTSTHPSTMSTAVDTSNNPPQASFLDGVPRTVASQSSTSQQRTETLPVPAITTTSLSIEATIEHSTQPGLPMAPLLDPTNPLPHPPTFVRSVQGSTHAANQLPTTPEVPHQSFNDSQPRQQVLPLSRPDETRELQGGQKQSGTNPAGISQVPGGSKHFDWDGFSSGEDDGELSLSKTSDTEYTARGASRFQVADGRPRRSPRKNGGTVFTDFLSGQKKKSDLTFDEAVRIGILLANKPPDKRHANEMTRLSELLADCNITAAVMDGVRMANVNNEARPSRIDSNATGPSQRKKGAETSEHEANRGYDPFDDVGNSSLAFDFVGHSVTNEYDITDRYLEGRIGGQSKALEGSGHYKGSAKPDQPRFLHGYVPATSVRSANDNQFEVSSNTDAFQDTTDFVQASIGEVIGRASKYPLPALSNNARPAIPPSTRTYPLPVAPGNTLARTANLPVRGTGVPSARTANPTHLRTNNAPPRNADLRARLAARPTNAMQTSAKVPLFEDDEDDEEEEAPSKKKRRQRLPKKQKRGKTQDNQPGEYFDLGGNGVDDEVEDEEVNDHKLSHYRGEEKKLVVRGIFYMRLFLMNVNAFPSKEELIKWAEKSFSASCQVAYGINYKDRMPQYTDGLSTLLQNEGWGVRGKVKKAATKLIDKFYNIYPPGNKYARFPNADEMETRHVEQRVKTLLGAQALYLKGYVPSQGEEVPYAHPAIKELIHVLVFSKKASKRPLAEQDLEAFNPIPLPLIAYACTALLNGLEELQTGQLVKKDFSEAEYANYYRILLNNIREMETDDHDGPILQDIREDIFDSGCRLFNMSVHDEYQRPPAPFVPLAKSKTTTSSNTFEGDT